LKAVTGRDCASSLLRPVPTASSSLIESRSRSSRTNSTSKAPSVSVSPSRSGIGRCTPIGLPFSNTRLRDAVSTTLQQSPRRSSRACWRETERSSRVSRCPAWRPIVKRSPSSSDSRRTPRWR
jgi:hypothetical protein